MQNYQDGTAGNGQNVDEDRDLQQHTTEAQAQVPESENEDIGYQNSEEGLANSDKEDDGLEKEAYINTDLISEDEIKDARESSQSETMPESPLSDPTERENN